RPEDVGVAVDQEEALSARLGGGGGGARLRVDGGAGSFDWSGGVGGHCGGGSGGSCHRSRIVSGTPLARLWARTGEVSHVVGFARTGLRGGSGRCHSWLGSSSG